jgi:hypothetical protein
VGRPGSFNVGKLKAWALATLPMLFFALGPQIILWYDRGAQWQGQYATFHADEYLYSAYLNSLIEGRPRRNDPFTGSVDPHKSSLPETAFSIQFVPSLTLASIGKVFRLSASSMFIALAVFGALSASASVYWLLSSTTQDDLVAARGTLLVLILGTLAGGQGLIGVVLKLDIVALGLPFVRRYQPAFAFGGFFIFCSFIWLALNAASTRKRVLYSALSGLVLITLTFSYLYLWTAAVAWLGCVVVLWVIFRWNVDAVRVIQVGAITAIIFALGLLPYQYLLSHRSSTLDELQTVVSTHRPDLFRIPELIGVLLLVAFAITVRQLRQVDSRVILGASFCLLPVVVFNQQVLSGKSVQPFHFEVFILNYAVLVGAVILLASLWPQRFRSALPWATAVCLLLGLVEVALVTGGFHGIDVKKDRMVPVARRLKELPAAQQSGETALVFSPHIEFNQMLPTYAPQGTLLGMGSVDFGSASHDERKDFLFTHLYYSGVTPEGLRDILKGLPDQLQLSYYVKYVIFGHERVRPVFSLDFKPISETEKENAISKYADFVRSWSPSAVSKRPITYAIANDNFDFSIIDRWYQRDQGERLGDYVLFRLTPRSQ